MCMVSSHEGPRVVCSYPAAFNRFTAAAAAAVGLTAGVVLVRCPPTCLAAPAPSA
jgi:hypothetical protein